jgi:nitroreductase/dihydropteridine reductase
MNSEEITKALSWRYAVRAFDPSKKVSDADLQAILESGRLAPSSFGLEAWKFIVVKNPEIRAKLRAAGYDQPRFTESSDLIIIAQRTITDTLSSELVERTALAQSKTPAELQGMRDMLDGSIARMSPEQVEAWLKNQTYIPLGMMMETASLLHIDNAAMEGFDKAQVDEILGLAAKGLTAVSALSVGYRAEEGLPKTRRTYNDVVEIIG